MSYHVDIKQRTVSDWEHIIRHDDSEPRCRHLILKALIQDARGKLPLSTSQHNLLEAALNTGDLWLW